MKEIQYEGKTISYTLQRSRIKNLYIYIKNGEVIVKSPLGLSNEHIEDFLSRKTKWIYDNLEKSKDKVKKEKEEQEKIGQEDIIKLQKIVKENVYKYSKILGKNPKKVRIRDLKYAWGSCSSNRNISINLKLATKDERAIEYVILHEMCHLIYMNHSKSFWNLVEKNMPNYKEYKKLLA